MSKWENYKTEGRYSYSRGRYDSSGNWNGPNMSSRSNRDPAMWDEPSAAQQDAFNRREQEKTDKQLKKLNETGKWKKGAKLSINDPGIKKGKIQIQVTEWKHMYNKGIRCLFTYITKEKEIMKVIKDNDLLGDPYWDTLYQRAEQGLLVKNVKGSWMQKEEMFKKLFK